jgi:hypothetical protein
MSVVSIAPISAASSGLSAMSRSTTLLALRADSKSKPTFSWMTPPNCRCAYAAAEGASSLNECLLLKEERKSRLRPPTSEFDPTQTSDRLDLCRKIAVAFASCPLFRCQSGKHLLAASISPFDPTETWGRFSEARPEALSHYLFDPIQCLLLSRCCSKPLVLYRFDILTGTMYGGAEMHL